MVTQWIVAGGARLATPGEFTRRAFLNGRIDLAQAEAVALLIGARTDRAVALAARALAGGLADRVRAWRDALVDVIAGLEVVLDFPDERSSTIPTWPAAAILRLHAEVERVVTAARHGRVVHDGITVALVGPPNAGKSSLLNALLGRDRAIVSALPGTTRDVVDATIVIAGVPVRLLDTAGLDVPQNSIEAEGMRRSRMAIAESDLLLVVLDTSVPLDRRVLTETSGQARMLVRAKSDLPCHPEAAALTEAVEASTVMDGGVDALLERLAREVEHRAAAAGDEGGIVASMRQIELIDALRDSLASSGSALRRAPAGGRAGRLEARAWSCGRNPGRGRWRRRSRPNLLNVLRRQVTPLEALAAGALTALGRRLSSKERDQFSKYLTLLLKWQKIASFGRLGRPDVDRGTPLTRQLALSEAPPGFGSNAGGHRLGGRPARAFRSRSCVPRSRSC